MFEEQERLVRVQHRPLMNEKVVDVIIENRLAISKSEARRYIIQKAVKVNGVLIEDIMAEVKKGDEVEIRKRKWTVS